MYCGTYLAGESAFRLFFDKTGEYVDGVTYPFIWDVVDGKIVIHISDDMEFIAESNEPFIVDSVKYTKTETYPDVRNMDFETFKGFIEKETTRIERICDPQIRRRAELAVLNLKLTKGRENSKTQIEKMKFMIKDAESRGIPVPDEAYVLMSTLMGVVNNETKTQ